MTSQKCKALFQFLLLTAAVLFTNSLFAQSKAAKPLNLLIITADDLNGDSWFNSKVPVTPNIDAFARTAYRFEQCHVSAPICQPSRSALMTGRVPHRNGALGFGPINLDVPTLVEVMSSNGYFTAALNKAGHMAPMSKFQWDERLDGSGKNPATFREQMEQCFKIAAEQKKPFFINANITDPHRPFANAGGEEEVKEEPVVSETSNQSTKTPRELRRSRREEAQSNSKEQSQRLLKSSPTDRRGNRRNRAGTVTNELSETTTTTTKTIKSNQANSALVKSVAASEVFIPGFLEELPDIRKEVAQYHTSVRRFDESFAAILSALKAAKHENDTVVVFLSDHGMSFPFSKATLYRNGTSSPVLFKWPGSKPFNNTKDMVSSVDVMPTVLELLKIEKPSSMDGRSLVPLMQGKKLPDTDHVFTHVNTVSSGKAFPGRCIRTTKRAYIWNAWPDGKTRYKVEAMAGLTFAAMEKAAANDSKIKERVNHWLYRTAEEFYDEEKDPSERRNLIKDALYQKEIAAMKKQLLAHMERTNDPLVEQFRKTVK